MSDLYPPESQKMDFIGHLDELRRRILISLAFWAVASALILSRGQALLAFLEKPAGNLVKEFIAITPTETFVVYIKVVLLASFVICFPVILYEFWAFIAPAVNLNSRRRVFAWFIFALICFGGGLIFAYRVLLPAALTFLLSFGENIARPMISIDKYFSFAAIIIVGGGTIFEIPVILGLLTEAGIMNAKRLRSARRYAILIIFIVAAVVTPTQDVTNLILFAVPMVLLYEIGIIISALVERSKKT